jgi:hypothetical protein
MVVGVLGSAMRRLPFRARGINSISAHPREAREKGVFGVLIVPLLSPRADVRYSNMPL